MIDYTPPPPTVKIAREAVVYALDYFSQAVDGKIVIGKCPRKGKRSRVCATRIDGPEKYKFRVIVTCLGFDCEAQDIQIRRRK